MRRAFVAAFAVMVGGASCAEDKASVFSETAAPSTAPAPAPGSIAMRLVGSDAQGRPYWLRSATFIIAPSGAGIDGGAPGTVTVSSEDDPEAEVLSVSLDPGSYEVTLQPGWYLEYQATGGVQRARNVRLTSPATQPVSITADQSAELIFRFAVDDSGRGTLGIGVEVETVDGGGIGADAGGIGADAGRAVDGGIDGGLGGEIDAGEADAATPDASLNQDAGAVDDDAGELDPDASDIDEDAGDLDDDAGDPAAGDAAVSDADPPAPIGISSQRLR